jgi:hypothetical protein
LSAILPLCLQNASLNVGFGFFSCVIDGCLAADTLVASTLHPCPSHSQYNLPTGIPKKDDKQAFDYDFTVQCEALPPDVLASILTTEIEDTIDMNVWSKAVIRQTEISSQLVKALGRTHLL